MLPVLRRADGESEGGRGLLLVQRLAERLGSYRAAGGKVVWAVRSPGPTPLPRRRNAARPPAGAAARPDVTATFLRRVLVGLEAEW
ncbi:hypothetical protein [Streptomyces sp. NPDC059247]|uniref:hypothetical protein n=1 Tax=Streptomyces sp. NPDC059247 TaxID=3346790 RepID=UPI003688D49B